MKILVTGGAGFIGSHVVDAYQKAGHEVAVLDNFSTGKRSNLPPDIRIFEFDITDGPAVKKVMDEFAPDIVNHHAAQISVTFSVDSPEHDARLNVLGTVNVLEAVRTLPSFKKFIYASSGGAMYGQVAKLPATETTPPLPLSPYGLTKHIAEEYTWLYARLYNLNATVLRYSNVYGPRQDPHGEAGVCAIFSERMKDGQPVTIYGDGSAVRDYVYVGDVAAANLLAIEKGNGEAFNICTGVGTSTLQVYEDFKKALQYNQPANFKPLRAGELQEVVLDPAKAGQGLGWKAEHNFVQGVGLTAAWYRESSKK